MLYVEAPAVYSGDLPLLFLAGGITDCPMWQSDALEMLADVDFAVANPRRRNFPMADPNAAPAQVRWEFDHLERADVVLFWFAGGPSVQPIALHELGAHRLRPIVVGCDPAYLRRQDVLIQMSLARPELPVFETLDATVDAAVKAMAEVPR